MFEERLVDGAECGRGDVEWSYWRSVDMMKIAINISDSEEMPVTELAPPAQHTHRHVRLQTG